MITYPILAQGATLGVTAPSSGARPTVHHLLHEADKRLTAKGYKVRFGETPWTQNKVRSAHSSVRAAEFQAMMQDKSIDVIIPPWGGELLIEMVEHIDFSSLPAKWIVGYSDVSLLLFTVTIKTGIATAHAMNFIDLRGETSDETTGMWESVLSTKTGGTVAQHSSQLYQKEWTHDNPSPHVFNLTEQTEWRTVSGNPVRAKGRLLGGCIDIIRHVIGTPYGDVRHFQSHFIQNEPIVWYLENCELNTADLRRSLVQMKLAGWFANCSAILFGRNGVDSPFNGYTHEEVYAELAEELDIPIVYDIDCGHVPPQMTFINGAYAEIEVQDGKGTVVQRFKG
ncbi:S66 peptidase family protein [Paenibacillus sp. NEAU-GSW1]|uniref:S66 family peptidase n=1 Tax=Paenibacillus sp. NEAU-GSW1 TaxID=2682486 RepID=UPI0012E1178B|nr:S66 peptidase family protein [Paenibacillus sp. NEAU-GSW1]MUT66251.1 LD-carboxypeptidase [Paenibacillus sp. NEAU-GSW1]